MFKRRFIMSITNVVNMKGMNPILENALVFWAIKILIIFVVYAVVDISDNKVNVSNVFISGYINFVILT